MVTSQTDSTNHPHGGPSAEEEIMREFVQHQRVLFVFLRTLLNDSADAEEVLQETSIVLWRKRHQFLIGTNFVNWAMAIAKYEALKFLRSRKRLPQPLDEEVLEKMATEMSARYDVLEIRRRALEQCLEALREQDRHLVNIVYGANTPHSKLCVPLGMTSNQFYKTLNRIRHKLQKCIQFRLLAEARS